MKISKILYAYKYHQIFFFECDKNLKFEIKLKKKIIY